jgi:hypothetical protein
MKKWIIALAPALATALLAAALSGSGPSGGNASPGSPPEKRNYEAACEVMGPRMVDGYVTNRGAHSSQVDGYVRFRFHIAGGTAPTGVDQLADAIHRLD